MAELRDGNSSRKEGLTFAEGTAGKRDTLQEDVCRDKKLTQPQIEANHKRLKTGGRTGNLMIRTIDIARAKAKIGL